MKTVLQFHKMHEALQAQRAQLKEELEVEERTFCKQLKEYSSAVSAILDMHREQIVTDARQVLIILLENYITKINTPLLSCSSLDQSFRKKDKALATHCLNLLKPNPDVARTGDRAIYLLLEYLHRNHDALDIAQGTVQLLCAFFSTYRHYAEGLSEELIHRLHIHDVWLGDICSRWVHSALIDAYDGSEDAFKKLSVMANWQFKNRDIYQKYFTQIILALLNERTMSTRVKTNMLESLGSLRAWIDPSLKGEVIQQLAAFMKKHTSLGVKLVAQRALKALMKDRTCSAQVDEIIEALLNRKKQIMQHYGPNDIVLFSIASSLSFYSDFASPNMQAKLMEHFADEFPQASNRASEDLFFHLFNELHLTIPSEIQDGVIEKIVNRLSYDEQFSFLWVNDYKYYCKAFLRIRDKMTQSVQENLCYDIFKYFLEYCGWDNIERVFTRLFPDFIEMMSTKKRVELLEYAYSRLLVEFDQEQYEDVRSFYLWNKTRKRSAILVIGVLIESLPNAIDLFRNTPVSVNCFVGTVLDTASFERGLMAMHTRFFNALMDIYMDEHDAARIDAEETIKKIDWHLSDECNMAAIERLLTFVNAPKRSNAFSLSALTLIGHLSLNVDKTACNALSDRLLALFNKSRNSSLKTNIVRALTDLQPRVDRNTRVVVAESLIDFLRNSKKKKIIREAIIAFIE